MKITFKNVSTDVAYKLICVANVGGAPLEAKVEIDNVPQHANTAIALLKEYVAARTNGRCCNDCNALDQKVYAVLAQQQ